MGELVQFFNPIAHEKYFDKNIQNPVSMGGEGATEVKYKYGRFITLYNYNINVLKQDQFYANPFQIGIKEKKLNVSKSLKDLLNMAMQNRVSDDIMTKSNNKALAHFPEMLAWPFLIPINKPVVDRQNEFSVARTPKIPDYSEVQFVVKNDFSETFQRKKFYGEYLVQVSFIILLLVCEKSILAISLNFFFIFIYFTQNVRIWISLV